MDIKTLIAVATGKIPHNYRSGLCPDELQPDSRDPDCQACKILTEAEARVAELETDAARYRYIRTHRIGVKWCELYACGPGLDAKLEKQKPVAYLTADKNMLVFADKCVDMRHLMTPLYAATPVTAPVRLTDRDKDDLAAPYSGMGGIEDYRAYAQDIETAALRANGFDIQPARGEG